MRLLAYRVWAMMDRGLECAREASIGTSDVPSGKVDILASPSASAVA